MAQNWRLLSIDDSKAVHAYLDRALTGTPFELLQSLSGEAGPDLLKQGGSHIQLVLLDWEMPGKSGREILSEIRKSNNIFPVVVVTSKNQPSDIQ